MIHFRPNEPKGDKIDKKIKNKNDILILNRHKNKNVRIWFQQGLI
jgi:hypothetical protein